MMFGFRWPARRPPGAVAHPVSCGRAAAAAILGAGEGTWHIHGVGIDSGEDIPETLRAGMVVAYEPGFSIGPDAYYLEDMVLVTDNGHRVLSTGLPYTAGEIERLMRGP